MVNTESVIDLFTRVELIGQLQHWGPWPMSHGELRGRGRGRGWEWDKFILGRDGGEQ